MREVEAAGDQRALVDDHDLVVGDGVVGVDMRRQPVLLDERQFGVSFLFLAAIQNDVDVHAPFLRVHKRLGDSLGSERIGEDEDFSSGFLDLADHGLGASPLG